MLWLLKKLSDLQNSLPICDACGKFSQIKTTFVVSGGICVCEQCVNDILIFHMLTHSFKTLCPYCHKKGKDAVLCHSCSMSHRFASGLLEGGISE